MQPKNNNSKATTPAQTQQNIDDASQKVKRRRIERELQNAPDCFFKSHVNGDIGKIEFVCLRSQCDFPTRFLCERCPTLDPHFSKHRQYISRIADIYSKDLIQVNWPCDEQSERMRQIISERTQEYEETEDEKASEDSQTTVVKKIEQFYNLFQEAKEAMRKQVKVLKENFENCIRTLVKILEYNFQRVEEELQQKCQDYLEKNDIFIETMQELQEKNFSDGLHQIANILQNTIRTGCGTEQLQKCQTQLQNVLTAQAQVHDANQVTKRIQREYDKLFVSQPDTNLRLLYQFEGSLALCLKEIQLYNVQHKLDKLQQLLEELHPIRNLETEVPRELKLKQIDEDLFTIGFTMSSQFQK